MLLGIDTVSVTITEEFEMIFWLFPHYKTLVMEKNTVIKTFYGDCVFIYRKKNTCVILSPAGKSES